MLRRRRPNRPAALAEFAPLRILSRIVILQLAYYGCAACIIIFVTLVAGRELRFDLILSWRTLRSDSAVGWTLALSWVLNSVICVVHLLLLVARSKLIPDFVFTIHFLHLILTSLYTHAIPSHSFWWLLQICNAALMTAIGIWSCQQRELQPIKFGKRRALNVSANFDVTADKSNTLVNNGPIYGHAGQDEEYELRGLNKGVRS